jgi:hypothetical protein
MKNLVITESQKNEILRMHNSSNVLSEVVITDWLSPDENYIIFLDELYDIQKNKRLGNIWENADNLYFFLKHSFEVANNVPQNIREEVLTQISKSVITESKKDLREFKQVLLEAGFWQGAKDIASGAFDFLTSPSQWGDWLKEKGIDAVSGTKEFVGNVAKGSKELISKISDGDWKEVFSLLGKGILYVARKLRAALYNPVGMILDAILIATGIGKSVQWIPWAIVVCLDFYEVTTQNFEEQEPLWMRALFIGCDILALVTAGGAGKAVKTLINSVVGGAKDAKSAANAISKNPALKKTIFEMVEGSKKVPDLLKKASSFLQKSFPMAAKFIDMTLGSITRGIEKLVNSLKTLTGETIKKGTKEAGKAFAKTSAILGGLESGIKNYAKKAEQELANSQQLWVMQGGAAEY